LEIIEPGGRQTLRLFFAADAESEHRAALLSRLNELGATYENADGTLYAVDLEPDASV
jgi:hypothetical protein